VNQGCDTLFPRLQGCSAVTHEREWQEVNHARLAIRTHEDNNAARSIGANPARFLHTLSGPELESIVKAE